MNAIRLGDLSAAWQALVRLCQELNFGYIDGLEIHDGAPVSYSAAVKTYMPGPNKENGPAVLPMNPSAPLRPQWGEVFALAASRANIHVRRLEVAHGTPLKLHVEIAGGDLHG